MAIKDQLIPLVSQDRNTPHPGVILEHTQDGRYLAQLQRKKGNEGSSTVAMHVVFDIRDHKIVGSPQAVSLSSEALTPGTDANARAEADFRQRTLNEIDGPLPTPFDITVYKPGRN